MNTLTKVNQRPSFIEGAVVALVASLVISSGIYLLDWLLPFGLLARVLISLSGFAYLLYLFSRSPEKTGRITVLAVYVVAVLVTWVMMPALQWVVVLHVGLIWLIRSLYFYSSVLSALLDLGLTAFSLVAAVTTYLHTGSVFLSLWSLFLTQALFVWIPVDWQQRSSGKGKTAQADRFNTAYQAAENAVRQLAVKSNAY